MIDCAKTWSRNHERKVVLTLGAKAEANARLRPSLNMMIDVLADCRDGGEMDG